MGRRILRSLRGQKPSEKSLDVKIEVDDGTVLEVNGGNTLFVTSNSGAAESVEDKNESPGVESAIVVKKAPKKRQVYVPPKIWNEDFDSDSDTDANTCWLFGSSPSKRRKERRESIAYQAKSMDERDEPNSFCGVFDCAGGAYEDEPYTYQEREGDARANELYLSEEPSYSTGNNRQISPETDMTSVLSDSFDGANEAGGGGGGDDEEEGVEQTEDAFRFNAAKMRDLDLDRFRMKRIRKKLKKRRKGRKHRKENGSASEVDDEMDTVVSTESTSTTGESTVISIKHVIADIDNTDASSEYKETRQNLPDESSEYDETRQSLPDEAKEYEETHENLPDKKYSGDSTSSPDDSPLDDPKEHQMIGNSTNDTDSNSASISSRKSTHSYESLGQDGSDYDSDEDKKKKVRKSKPNNAEAMLSRVFDAVEASAGFLAFPDIPQPTRRKQKLKSKSTKRVRFAPDVVFNDEDEYDYSLDYSYSDPEFDDGSSVDEETYYTAKDKKKPVEDEEDDDDEAFFDDGPVLKTRSSDESEDSVPSDDEVEQEPRGEVASYDDEIEKSYSTQEENCIYDANDEILDFDDDDDLEDMMDRISLESGFEYFEEGEQSGGESSANAPQSSYKTIEELKQERATSPFEPSTIRNEISSSDDLDADVSNEASADYETSEKPKQSRPVSPIKSSMAQSLQAIPSAVSSEPEPDVEFTDTDVSGDLGSLATSEEQQSYRSFQDTDSVNEPPRGYVALPPESKDEAEIEEAVVAVGNHGNAGRSMKPLKPPQPTNDDDSYSTYERKLEKREYDSVNTEQSGVRRAISPNEALVERYLNISVSYSDRTSQLNDTVKSTLTEEASVPSKSGNVEHTRPFNNSVAEPKTVQPVKVVAKNREEEKKADMRDDFSDWLQSPETAKYLPVLQALSKRKDAREGWPYESTSPESGSGSGFGKSVESQSIGASEAGLTSNCDDFSAKNAEEMDRLLSSAKRLKSKGRISDKKESLQLSLQGFARAKDPSADWADFNNRPFQDLEVAPFDER